MHVLFVTGEYPPMQGGVGAYTAALGRALMALGVRVTVLTSVQARQGESGEAEPQVLAWIERWNWPMVTAVARTAAGQQADWIHVQYQTAAYAMHPAINLAPIWWRRKRLPVAWTYHDLLVPYLFPKAGPRLRRWITERPAFNASLVVATNEGDRLQLAGRGLAPARIPIGSNVPGIAVTPAQRAAQRARRGYGGDDLVVGYFGFLNRSKGGLTLVRTLHRLVQCRPNAYLLMIGERVGASDPTNLAYLHQVEQEADALGLAGRIQWTGRQPDAGVSADLAACDVLLMPYEDGASLRRGTLMAGLANGCAMVTTAPQAPLPELVDGRDLLYVPAGDAQAAAQAVARLAGDPNLAGRLRANARQRSAEFSWSAIARRHLSLYAQFLRDPAP